MDSQGSHDAFPLKQRWLVFASIFFIALCVALNMMKAPPIFTTLIPELGFSESNIGLTVSVYLLMSVILAFPIGALIRRFGAKKLLVATGIITTAGSILGTFAYTVPLFLASRLIEGVSYALITVVAIAAIATVMPNKVKGLAMGIYSAWYPLGTALAMLIAPSINAAFGWHTLWWLTAGLSVIATIFVALIYKQPSHDDERVKGEEGTNKQSSEKDEVKPDYRSIVFLAAAFLFWCFVWSGSINSFYPTYLQLAQGVSAQKAGFMVSLPSLLGLALGPIFGALSDRSGKRKWLVIVGIAGTLSSLVFAFGNSLALSWVFILVITIPAAVMPVGVFALLPDLAKKPQNMGFAAPILAFFQDTGSLIGAGVFGLMAAFFGWHSACWYLLVPAGIASLVCACMVKAR
jgi:MFS family permease